jgi:hypothetical protein
MSTFALLGNYARPDRTIPENQKDKNYDNQWARHTVAYGYLDARHQKDIERIKRNRNFFMNRQWEMKEDLDTFLKDQTGQDRNRITFTLNKISSLVNMYRGNVSKLTLEFGLKNISPYSYTRKEQGLKKLLFIFDQANRVPEFGDTLRQKLPIGDTEQATITNYNRSYVDSYIEEMKPAMAAIAALNEFSDRIKPAVAESLAFAGRAHVFYTFEGSHQRFYCLPPENVWWDRSAIEYDFQDGLFNGYIKPMSPTQIIELAEEPLTDEQRKALLDYGQGYMGSGPPMYGAVNGQYSTTTIPVFHTYWRDTIAIWFGYVQDDQGQVTMQKINWIEDGDTEPLYTDEDLVDPPKDSRIAKRFNGKKKIKINCDYYRYCIFVPWEYVSGRAASDMRTGKKDLDIVIARGPLPYQDHRYQDFSTCRSPMKSWCWYYSDGEVTAPMDDAISPQRFLNRVLSVAENQMNNSGASGTIIDRDSLDGDGDQELQIMSDMNQGKPVIVSAKRQGIGNIVGTYDGTAKAGTYKMFDLVPFISSIVDQSVGVNESMRGESIGQDQLVGVFDRMMEQGSIIQAPFYNAVASIFKQCYQAMADTGKRFYIDNPSSLVDISGDYGAKVITLSAGMRNEDMRVEIQQEQSSKAARQLVDATLFQFAQTGFIDRGRFANLYGRATMSQVLQGMRDYAEEVRILSHEQRKMAEAERQAFMQSMQEQQSYERNLPIQEHTLQVERDNNKHRNTIERDRNKAVVKNINSTQT